MIEELVRSYLDDRLDCGAYTEEPDGIKTFVVIEKVGSGDQNKLGSGRVAIKSYGESLYKAAALNKQVKSIMEEITDHVLPVTYVNLNTDYNFTDQAKKRYRYQAVYDLNYL